MPARAICLSHSRRDFLSGLTFLSSIRLDYIRSAHGEQLSRRGLRLPVNPGIPPTVAPARHPDEGVLL
jgi:hypothetical protein